VNVKRGEAVFSYVAINSFIVVYLFYSYVWTAPDNSALKPFLGLIRSGVRYFGLWHSWSMFAPKLFSITRQVELQVEFEDGGVTVWKPDYHSGMARFQRFRNERFRKLGENCREGEFAFVRGYVCEYVIRTMQKEHRESFRLRSSHGRFDSRESVCTGNSVPENRRTRKAC
jgi:hypothetical protein